MGEQTKIQWCDKTFNGWEGCTKVSEGCAHCYAEARNHRFGLDNWGKGKARRRTKTWGEPLKWNRDSRQSLVARRPRVFCASLADWLDDEVPIEWLADLLKLIHDTPNLDWQLLTKRPENWLTRLQQTLDESDFGKADARYWVADWRDGKAPHNVWIGTSVENQAMADKRIPLLLDIPARVRFLSCEPLLGPLRLPFIHYCQKCASSGFVNGTAKPCPHCGGSGIERAEGGIQWVIVGGESGHKARPCNVEWIRGVVQQCQAARVPVFVKQLGADPLIHWPMAGNDGASGLVHARHAGRLAPHLHLPPFRDKKGGDIDEFPNDLKVREFPV